MKHKQPGNKRLLTHALPLMLWLMLAGMIPAVPAFAQQKIIDEVVGVVGNNTILFSDIENQYQQIRLQGGAQAGQMDRCRIFENLLYQKLLLNQAQLDSIQITETQVDAEMERKLRFFIQQIGSKEKLEQYYDKSIVEIKEEFKNLIRDQMMIEEMQNKITKDFKITPSEIKSFLNKIPTDSIPLVNSEVEIGQIVKQPPIGEEEKKVVIDKLRALRERILKGEDFATMAVLYSEDPGSAKNGGELGLVKRGELYPEFEAIAFKLKPKEVSDVVETKAGFHIIQLIERKGEYVNVRHILLQPRVSPLDLAKAKKYLDSVYVLIKNNTLTFDKAATLCSDDPSKNNGGMLVNPISNTTRFETDQVDPSIAFLIDKMEPGDLSPPTVTKSEDGKESYRILFLKSRTKPHKASLKTDYDRIQNWASDDKKSRIIDDWMTSKITKTFIFINPKYKSCHFQHKWFN